MALSGNPGLIVALTTTLGLEDLYDLLEVRRIDGYNERLIRKAMEKES